ncbi:high affinity cGMP-specific 3',5'-cyclic phosphodiesterase 9A [Thecamonas trahens ATCC 50062]|uniref:High affinity cGMP-specific 3',5'-cyclic phosphodiesterase 9A n=1 Tax=Thecamonas trahens ATCC 50062 TaxID=461836 RepID=A0A0L0DTE8_THETB|nr:high affinity cGMP-specific 3',5'-cyclic phosphodiesterase 9A [Thecamonas trahens ATCC 50062]KNC54728.1 high affinity cGMP-specific 3',5'-cyclic phosphodiesterase 9A [Thecamonas trahens ATCC 50062]|eukprot:XP_013761628.1 high affinity cGMP-specific 3',5'-cyclic phosphodiesterase 9A [Thecamonas trahens ATCC 50062]
MADTEAISVLVVEDEPTTRLIVERFLRQAGHTVASAKNGELALRKIERKPEKFQLVLSDVYMPKLNGMELLGRIRGHENTAVASLVVVMMSSAKDAATSYQALQAGADDFILKPVRKGTFDKFAELVRKGHTPPKPVNPLRDQTPRSRERRNSIMHEQKLIVDATETSPISSLAERVKALQTLAAQTNADEQLRQELNTLRTDLDRAMQSLLLSSSASSTSAFVDLVEQGTAPPEAKAYITSLVGDQTLHGAWKIEPQLGGAVAAATSASRDTGDSDDEASDSDAHALKAVFELTTFDVWSSPEEMMSQYVVAMFRHLGLLQHFLIPKEVLEAFLDGVAAQCPITNPYHSFRRSVDSAQLAFWILTRGGAQKHLDAHDVLAVMLAVIAFQMGHTGTSNNYLIESSSDYAMQYNNESILENRAASLACGLLAVPSSNVLANVEPAKAEYVKNLMTHCILATDLKAHPKILSSFNLVASQFNGADGVHRRLLCQVITKTADFSLDIRPFTLAKYWSDMKAEEDVREAAAADRPVPLTDPGMVRVTLIDYISLPLFSAVGKFLPVVEATCHSLIETNRFTWQALVDTQMFS